MAFQSWGGLFADLSVSFAMEVLLVAVCYWAISSRRVRARHLGSEKCGAELSSPLSPRFSEETSQRDAEVDGPRGAPAGSPVAAAGKGASSISRLHQKEAGCAAAVCSSLKTQNWSQVLEVIHGMYEEGIYPSSSFYSHVMLMAKFGKQWELVVATFLLMQAHGVPPWVGAWKLYCTATDYLQGHSEERRCTPEQQRASLADRGLRGEVSTYRFVIFIYGIETNPFPDFGRLQDLGGELQRARLCLTTSTYNAILAACQAPLRFGFAFNIFATMRRCGCTADIFTLTLLVRICARQAGSGAPSGRGKARRFMCQLLNEHVILDLTHAHAALDALRGEKDWTVALDILESMKHLGIVAHVERYKRVIKGFQASKQCEYAIQVAEECLTHCAQLQTLDLPFYTSLLSCCDVCNNADSAMFFFAEMQKFHVPGVDEYNALLQCLLKCNCEADVARVLVEMGSAGVMRNSRTESILAMHVSTDNQ